MLAQIMLAHSVWAASPRQAFTEGRAIAPTPAAATFDVTSGNVTLQCDEPKSGRSLSFCKVDYPIKEFSDDPWILYQDALAKDYFEREYLKNGSASSVCLAATKSLVCSRCVPASHPFTPLCARPSLRRPIIGTRVAMPPPA